MGILPALIGTVISIIAYAMVFAGVYKLFAISTELAEIKKLLSEQKREAEFNPDQTVVVRVP